MIGTILASGILKSSDGILTWKCRWLPRAGGFRNGSPQLFELRPWNFACELISPRSSVGCPQSRFTVSGCWETGLLPENDAVYGGNFKLGPLGHFWAVSGAAFFAQNLFWAKLAGWAIQCVCKVPGTCWTLILPWQIGSQDSGIPTVDSIKTFWVTINGSQMFPEPCGDPGKLYLVFRLPLVGSGGLLPQFCHPGGWGYSR